MKEQPLVSVIIPVYNVERYLAQCLDSVINQTYPNLEIICVNDGSRDGSPDILRRYADEDARIQVIDKANGGVSQRGTTRWTAPAGNTSCSWTRTTGSSRTPAKTR